MSFRGHFWQIILLIIAALFAGCATEQSNHRLWVDGQVNNKPARFIFDTGATTFNMSESGAANLSLNVTKVPANITGVSGPIPSGVTSQYPVSFWGHTENGRFLVRTFPAYMSHDELDGIIGWRQADKFILQLDALTGNVRALDALPPDIAAWTQFRILPSASMLELESINDGPHVVLNVDSGSINGIELSRVMWRQWRDDHPRVPFTYQTYYTPDPGLVNVEASWAKEITLGPLTFRDILITEQDEGINRAGAPNAVATLCFDALRYFDIILDGPGGYAYFKAKTPPPKPNYSFNRLGAIFVPSGDVLKAVVLPGTPAFGVGIRNGDILIKVGRYYRTDNWRDDPFGFPLNAYTHLDEGDGIYLTLKRGERIYSVTVYLRDILNNGDPLPP